VGQGRHKVISGEKRRGEERGEEKRGD